jgi:hypothetical protein
MALIRIPKSAEPLLPYCKPYNHRLPNACFETYAEFIVFAAGYGFYKNSSSGNSLVTEFLDQPYPIDMAIFKNQDLFPLIIFLGIALVGNRAIIKQEDALARITENYTDTGCRELLILLKQSTPESFHLELSTLIQETIPK